MLKLIRWILRGIILFYDRSFSPAPMVRGPSEQAEVDRATVGLVLYQFEACPFCVKVRRAILRQALKVELRDAKLPEIAKELKAGGGSVQVPCLRIPEADGKFRWLYESDAIIGYLGTLSGVSS